MVSIYSFFFYLGSDTKENSGYEDTGMQVSITKQQLPAPDI